MSWAIITHIWLYPPHLETGSHYAASDGLKLVCNPYEHQPPEPWIRGCATVWSQKLPPNSLRWELFWSCCLAVLLDHRAELAGVGRAM